MAQIIIRMNFFDDGTVEVTDEPGNPLNGKKVNPRKPVKEIAHFVGGNVQWWGGSPFCVQHGDRVY